ncbi:uncharacterized protein [Clytia hemisphaerica]|eukprot:TCONS_00011582-protein
MLRKTEQKYSIEIPRTPMLRNTQPEIQNTQVSSIESDDSEGLWTGDVESCFQEALRMYPPCGRQKIMISSRDKMYGRNELIAKHILNMTGKVRTRKQVASHIQVLARKRVRVLSSKQRSMLPPNMIAPCLPRRHYLTPQQSRGQIYSQYVKSCQEPPPPPLSHSTPMSSPFDQAPYHTGVPAQSTPIYDNMPELHHHHFRHEQRRYAATKIPYVLSPPFPPHASPPNNRYHLHHDQPPQHSFTHADYPSTNENIHPSVISDHALDTYNIKHELPHSTLYPPPPERELKPQLPHYQPAPSHLHNPHSLVPLTASKQIGYFPPPTTTSPLTHPHLHNSTLQPTQPMEDWRSLQNNSYQFTDNQRTFTDNQRTFTDNQRDIPIMLPQNLPRMTSPNYQQPLSEEHPILTKAPSLIDVCSKEGLKNSFDEEDHEDSKSRKDSGRGSSAGSEVLDGLLDLEPFQHTF